MMTVPKSGEGVIFPALQIAICQIYSTDKSLSLFLGPPDDGDHHLSIVTHPVGSSCVIAHIRQALANYFLGGPMD